MLQEKVLRPVNDDKVERVVIILHGLGDNAAGIMGLGEAFQPSMPNTLFLAPDAPFPCPYVPGGYQWFGGDDWTPSIVLEGVKRAAPILNEYIDDVLERTKMTPDKVALIGFSQGTMMSLYVAPRREHQLAGVLGYSGALIGASELETEKKCAPPVLLAHGTCDSVVPFSAMAHAQGNLEACQIPVSSVTCHGLDHSVDEKGLGEGITFLRHVLKMN
ncbi:MAG: alpha/beta hydrolase [Bdellovibrionales bacterium]